MFKYGYPQTRKRKKRTARKSKDYAAWANTVSNLKDKTEHKLAYEDMYEDSKNKDDTEDNQYSDIEYFA